VKRYTIFGEITPDALSSIKEQGGFETAQGRELIVTYALQDYLHHEATKGGTVGDLVNSMLRVMARTIVTMGATLHQNGHGKSAGETSAMLMGYMDAAVQNALDEFGLPQTKTTAIHLNHGKVQ
jgi:hypothetical protein